MEMDELKDEEDKMGDKYDVVGISNINNVRQVHVTCREGESGDEGWQER